MTKPTSGETNDDDSNADDSNADEEAGRSSHAPAVDASVVAAESDAEVCVVLQVAVFSSLGKITCLQLFCCCIFLLSKLVVVTVRILHAAAGFVVVLWYTRNGTAVRRICVLK